MPSERVQCQKCKQYIDKNKKFCPYCGEKQTTAKKILINMVITGLFCIILGFIAYALHVCKLSYSCILAIDNWLFMPFLIFLVCICYSDKYNRDIHSLCSLKNLKTFIIVMTIYLLGLLATFIIFTFLKASEDCFELLWLDKVARNMESAYLFLNLILIYLLVAKKYEILHFIKYNFSSLTDKHSK